MVEGQMGLTWARWRALTDAVERLGFAGLFRSDHFVNAAPPDDESLELVTSLTDVASRTSRIHFGSLVAPVSVRDPVMLARQAGAVGDLSGGRFWLGLGAGWSTREHEMFGYDLLDVPSRMARLAEATDVCLGLLRSAEPFSFEGRFYRLDGAAISPRPSSPPPLVIGGNGVRYTLPLAARRADVWNAVFLPASEFVERCERLDALLDGSGRARDAVRRTMMTGIYTGDGATLDRRLARLRARRPDASTAALVEDVRARGGLAGTFDEIPEQLRSLEKAGCQEVMLQWLWLDDVEDLAALAEAIL
jgi:alkanesulfonate monooxygenase SsuD/methylene tetrahydromethanopterin reductase-like flavin-dependent oxidoreductase (luciferase family)